MSYNLQAPCFNCNKATTDNGETGCSDYKDIQESITKIHSKTFEQGHKGSGTVVLMCCRMEPKS
jgi:hypothetical protein